MRQTALYVAAGLALATAASDAGAALCITKSGKLVVKSSCSTKKKDKPVTAPGNPDFGLRGEVGRGLAVVDSAGKEVGIGATDISSYYGTATVLRQAQDGTWLRVTVDGNGLVKRALDPRVFVFADAQCAGQKYFRTNHTGYYGTQVSNELAWPAAVDKDSVAHYAKLSERTSQLQLRFVEQVPYYGAATPELARIACTSSAGGALIGEATGCVFDDGPRFCQLCCVPFAQPEPGDQPFEGAPEHTEVLGPFTAPFRLKRQ